MIDHQDRSDLFAAQTPRDETPDPASVAESCRTGDTPDRSLGSKLRAAREAQALSVAACAGKLHLPIKVLERLEANDFGEPEHFVYLRGALKGYARLLGLPVGSCDEALRSVAPAKQPELVSVAKTSPTRWLLQRYGTAATYIVLTATIAVPLVLLGLRGGLERPSARVVSLDQASTLASPHEVVRSKSAPSSSDASPDSSPFRASMTPFVAIGLRDIDAPPAHASTTLIAPVAAVASAPAATPAAVGAHTLTVSASADCWFEITDADGRKIASGTLHAGDSRSWHSDGPLHVTLGDANVVNVTEDGKSVAMDVSRRTHVARLDLFEPSAVGSEND